MKNMKENSDIYLEEKILVLSTETDMKLLKKGSLIRYMDDEWVLYLGENRFLSLDFQQEPDFLEHNWIEDPYTSCIYEPLDSKEKLFRWLEKHPYFREKMLKFSEYE